MKKNVYINLAYILLAIVTYGFIAPYLTSSKNNELVITGIILAVGIGILLVKRVINQLN